MLAIYKLFSWIYSASCLNIGIDFRLCITKIFAVRRGAYEVLVLIV